MGLALDFTGLNSIAHSTAQEDFRDTVEAQKTDEKEPLKEDPIEVPLDSFKALFDAVNQTADSIQEEEKPLIDGEALVKLNREQEDYKRNTEIYKRYQENVRKSEKLSTEILKGARAGEPVELLFLKAVECIGCMTGDTVIYEQVEKYLKSVYGEGLLKPTPLELEIGGIKTRLDRLEEAYNRFGTEPEDKKRIGKAIEAHREKLAYLQGLLKESKKTA